MVNNDDKRQSQCVGKKTFKTFTQARRVSVQLNRRKDERAEAYRCKFCGLFHVGTTITHGAQPTTAPYARKPYAVYAKPPAGVGVLAGWSVHPDGHDIAAVLGPGWQITSVVKRARARA